jgi:hypothetical protein
MRSLVQARHNLERSYPACSYPPRRTTHHGQALGTAMQHAMQHADWHSTALDSEDWRETGAYRLDRTYGLLGLLNTGTERAGARSMTRPGARTGPPNPRFGGVVSHTLVPSRANNSFTGIRDRPKSKNNPSEAGREKNKHAQALTNGTAPHYTHFSDILHARPSVAAPRPPHGAYSPPCGGPKTKRGRCGGRPSQCMEAAALARPVGFDSRSWHRDPPGVGSRSWAGAAGWHRPRLIVAGQFILQSPCGHDERRASRPAPSCGSGCCSSARRSSS